MVAIRLPASTKRPLASSDRRRSRVTALVLVALLWTLLVAVTPAYAVPPPPPNPSDEQVTAADAAEQAAAAEVGRISGELAAAEGELARLNIVSEAATYEYLAAEGRLIAAQEAAVQSAAELTEAQGEVEGAQSAIVEFARGSYMSGSLLTNDMILLTSNDPGELIQRAAFLDYISTGRMDVLNNLEVARVTVANTDSTNRAAEIEMAAAEKAAAQAKAAAEAAYANGAVMVAQVQAQKADLDAQLQAAQVALLGVEGARAAYEAWEAQKRAEEAAAAERSRIAAEQAAAAELRRWWWWRWEPRPSTCTRPRTGRLCRGSSHIGNDHQLLRRSVGKLPLRRRHRRTDRYAGLHAAQRSGFPGRGGQRLRPGRLRHPRQRQRHRVRPREPDLRLDRPAGLRGAEHRRGRQRGAVHRATPALRGAYERQSVRQRDRSNSMAGKSRDLPARQLLTPAEPRTVKPDPCAGPPPRPTRGLGLHPVICPPLTSAGPHHASWSDERRTGRLDPTRPAG